MSKKTVFHAMLIVKWRVKYAFSKNSVGSGNHFSPNDIHRDYSLLR